MALAFALTSTMLSLPYRSPKTWDLLQFVRMASRMAMQEKALHASSPQAPYVSTASGMHCQPSSEHFVSFCSCFLDSAAFAATPAETPASETILELSGEVTVMKAMVVHVKSKETRICMRENVIVLYLGRSIYVRVLNIARTMTFSLTITARPLIVSLLFTPPLPSNPISHKLSHREGFLFTCSIHFFFVHAHYSDA